MARKAEITIQHIFDDVEVSKIRRKYASLKARVTQNTLKCFDINQYIQKLMDANIRPDDVGRNHGSYQLARYTDKGDYLFDTCRFILQVDNLKEMVANGGRKIGDIKGTLTRKSMYASGELIVTQKRRDAVSKKKEMPYKFISPEGILHEGINCVKFCREHNLTIANMSCVKHGKRKHHKGWTKA